MASPGDKLARFDRFLRGRSEENPWRPGGRFAPDHELLRALLVEAVGSSQQSGVVAGAVDVWAAEELRRAGFHPDDVWPRREPPRVKPRDLRSFLDHGLTRELRREVEARFSRPGARRALPAEAHVMGRAFAKQSDVLIASWSAGVELLISTKTMLSSYQKNLRNRFEEGYGDAKNLRGRHPLAALGFLFLVGADIPAQALDFATDMLRKLSSEADVYDCACLMVLDGAQGIVEGEAEAEPDAGAPSDNGADGAYVGDEDEEDELPLFPDPPRAPGAAERVRLDAALVPEDLRAERFFERLIGAALARMPVDVYAEVRGRRRAAQGPAPA
jgi:hypothetical protein